MMTHAVVIQKLFCNCCMFHMLQLPQGALPLAGSPATTSISISLAPYATRQLTSTFYFPEPGLFKRTPVSVTKRGRWARSSWVMPCVLIICMLYAGDCRIECSSADATGGRG
jgi:hypothetical protein